MYNFRQKILKKDPTKLTELEEEIAKTVYHLEMKSEGQPKEYLSHLFILGVENIKFQDRAGAAKTAILVRIPYRSLASFNKIRDTVIKALEKKNNQTVLVVAQRNIQSKFQKANKSQERPRSRTLTNVHDAILADIVAPSQIVGKHTRISDGKRNIKIFLDPLDKQDFEDKLDVFTEAYKKLTNKSVTFAFVKPSTFEAQLIEFKKKNAQ